MYSPENRPRLSRRYGKLKEKMLKSFCEFPKMDSVKLWNPKPESRKDTLDSSMDDFGQM